MRSKADMSHAAYLPQGVSATIKHVIDFLCFERR